MKKYRILCLVLVLSLTACSRRMIGTIHGAEWDTIVIGETEYVRVTDSGLGHSDRGAYLGTVSDGGKTTFRCYSVKHDAAGRYLYCLWDWEGSVYEKATNEN